MAEIDSKYRIPPQNIVAEQSLLGSIMLENESLNVVLEQISAEDFYKESHKKIFRAIVDMSEKGEPIDLVTLTEELSRRNQIDDIGGAAYLSSLLDMVPTAANIGYYANIVKEKAILRRVINTATAIVQKGYENEGEVGEFLDEVERMIFQISQGRARHSFHPIKDVVKDSFRFIERLYHKREKIAGIPTGFADLDKITSGLQLSDFIVIAGRPGMGKTAFCLNLCQNLAIRSKIPVGIFSLEMSKEQVVLRMLCSEARVDSSRLRKGKLNEKEWKRLTEAAGYLMEAPIFIDDSPVMSILEMKAKARRLKSMYDVGLIVVDYLQLMRTMHRMERREQEISEISRGLKALAKELNLPIIALSQLNRAVESRDNKRPRLADLRESGAIEQDADVIGFIYRDEVYNKDREENKGIAEIIIEKQRNGPIGVVKLAFIDKYTKFDNLYDGWKYIPEEEEPEESMGMPS